MGDVYVKMVMQDRSVMYVLMVYTKKGMVLNIYALVSVLLLYKLF